QEVLLVINICLFHNTQRIRNKFKNNILYKVVLIIIFSSLTNLLQPLDIAINSLFKKILKEETFLAEK
ncbi:hypothetical protein QBC45DRAFT_324922, partial [Copromyces sp. CBS 386.78]